MRSFIDKRIAEVLADHEITLLPDDRGRTVSVQRGFSGVTTMRHKNYFAAADYFAPILRDERLTRLVAA